MDQEGHRHAGAGVPEEVLAAEAEEKFRSEERVQVIKMPAERRAQRSGCTKVQTLVCCERVSRIASWKAKKRYRAGWSVTQTDQVLRVPAGSEKLRSVMWDDEGPIPGTPSARTLGRECMTECGKNNFEFCACGEDERT